jgi:hypothetical protein
VIRLPFAPDENPTDAAMLPVVGAAGALAARMAINMAAGATSDALEDFEDAVRSLREERGDRVADRALALIDTYVPMPRPDY